jgi:hypothetical protein
MLEAEVQPKAEKKGSRCFQTPDRWLSYEWE